jgi:hypothetical protein
VFAGEFPVVLRHKDANWKFDKLDLDAFIERHKTIL